MTPFDRRVLSALADCGGEAYSVTVYQTLKANPKGLFEKIGVLPAVVSVHDALDRLIGRGLVYPLPWEAGGPERDGKPRRIYRMSAAGWDALRAERVGVAS